MLALRRVSENLKKQATLNLCQIDLLSEATNRMAPLILAAADFQLMLTYGAIKAIISSLRSKATEATDRGEEEDYWYPGQEGRQV
jgi:hypothetical protein